jgi:hypothetical protein
MGIASEIRANLPLCGRCVNCKLLVWEEKAELKTSSNLIKFKSLDLGSAYYYMVRCSWLKSPVNEPQFLEICEGKQEYGAKG